MHLFLNVFSLWMFGYIVEQTYYVNIFLDDPSHATEEELTHAVKMARLAYIGLFTGGIYAASITEYFKNRNNPSYSSLGASGAIEAIIFSFIIIQPFQTLYLFVLPMPAWLLGIIFLAGSYYLSKRKTGDP
jgi:membrane associated rhomboid family serine protease